MVRKDDLLKHVSEQTRLEAQKPKLDEFATEDLVQEAADIVGDLFSAITWETVEGDVIKSTDPVTPWRGSLEDSYPPTANGHAGFLVIRVNPSRTYS